MCITDEFHKMFSWEKEADKGVHPVRFHTHEILEMTNLIYNDKKTQQINVCLGLEPECGIAVLTAKRH